MSRFLWFSVYSSHHKKSTASSRSTFTYTVFYTASKKTNILKLNE